MKSNLSNLFINFIRHILGSKSCKQAMILAQALFIYFILHIYDLGFSYLAIPSGMEDDLVEHRTREASSGSQRVNTQATQCIRPT